MILITPRAKGSIRSHKKIHGKIVHKKSVCGTIKTNKRYEIYTGPTEIYPNDSVQILDTANKNVRQNIIVYESPELPLQDVSVSPSLHDDLVVRASENYYGLDTVTVLKVPYEEIDNIPDGKTVKIGL